LTKSKQEKIKTSYDTEVRIAKKLHDELANDVTRRWRCRNEYPLIIKRNITRQLRHHLFSERVIFLKKIALAMGQIPNLKVISGFNTNSVNILISEVDTVNWLAMADIKKITVYRILQELLINMKKHSKSSLVYILQNI
jgi:signal transduction histidine kinase